MKKYPAIFIMAFCTSALAQDPEPTPPPLPVPLPKSGYWLVRTQQREAGPVGQKAPGANSGPEAALAVDILTRYDRSGDSLRVRTYSGDKIVSDSWLFQDGRNMVYPTNGILVVGQIDELSPEAALLKGVYPELSWMTLQDYKGIVKQDGRKRHHYAAQKAPGADQRPVLPGDSPTDPVEHEAWIDVETGRPVRSRTATFLRSYEFPEGAADSKLPPEFAVEIQKIVESQKVFSRRHAMP